MLIYMDGVAIAGCTSCDIQTSIDIEEVGAPLSSGRWKQYRTKRKSWSITANYLVLQDSDAKDLLTVGNTYAIKFKGRNSSDSSGVNGSAILKTCKITATKGNLVRGSFQFLGNNDLS